MVFCFCTGQTCPTVQSSNVENCVDECSSDDDCQYDRICCSNGCGGHTCSDSVEMCQVRSMTIIVLTILCYYRLSSVPGHNVKTELSQ